jgi:hypothetical protein
VLAVVGDGPELDGPPWGNEYEAWDALGLGLYGKVGESMAIGEYLRAAEDSSPERYCDEARW